MSGCPWVGSADCNGMYRDSRRQDEVRIRIQVLHRKWCVWVVALLLAPSLAQAGLGLHAVIPLPGVRGAFGGLAADARHQRLFVNLADDHRLLVVNLADGAVSGRVAGLDRPRGVAYLPHSDSVAVSSAGSGELDFYAAGNLAPEGAVSFGDSAGALLYDARQDRVYLAYGKGSGGGIAAVSGDAQPLEQFTLDSHPAGFVVDSQAGRLYVNLPARRSVAVFDLAQGRRVGTWKFDPGSGSNSAMALDAAAGRLFLATSAPDRLLVLDVHDGRILQALPAPVDVGSLSFDAATRELYAAGGVGRIAVYAEAPDGGLAQSDEIPSAHGATAACLDAAEGRYYLAVPAHGRQVAEIRVYNVTPNDAGGVP